ncbi:MAG: efflux RND transporter periplasmic adaptor subunit [Planctomycetaceae bacterium]|nr:efflux RND transporter periplasmic adaptor subunit [Planctomycetaceae bacterium]
MNLSWNSAKSWLWWFAKLFVVLAIGGGVLYWVRFSPVAVAAHFVERGPIVAEVMGTGTLEARVQATVSPKISGRIAKVMADQGDHVSAGRTLVTLDDAELQEQVAIAQANVEAANAAIERLKAERTRAVAVFEQAQRSHERIQRLVLQKATSQDDIDKANEALAVAESSVSRAEAAINEGQKAFIAAEKTLEYHRARLHDTEILAPFDGLIVKRTREPGDVVVPGSSILTLISMDELWISAWIDETEMARLRPEQSARVVFRSESDKSYPGKVVRLGREADRETREFVVDVRVLELPENWAVGQRAEAFIEVASKDDALLLPARLLIKRDGESGVYLNENGAARYQPITIGLRGREVVEVTDGLDQGDVVITPVDARDSIRPGQRLSITE